MVTEIPAIERFVQQESTISTLELSGDTPYSKALYWKTTGSEWADELVNVIGFRFTVSEETIQNNILIEVKNDDTVLVYQRLTSTETVLYIEDIEPGVVYSLSLEAESSTPISVTIAGVLPIVEY